MLTATLGFLHVLCDRTFLFSCDDSSSFSMEHTLTTLCKECIEQAVHQWLWTIPVLHLFSASIESECVKMNNPLESEERWAGLKDLAFVRYRNLEDTSGK